MTRKVEMKVGKIFSKLNEGLTKRFPQVKSFENFFFFVVLDKMDDKYFKNIQGTLYILIVFYECNKNFFYFLIINAIKFFFIF